MVMTAAILVSLHVLAGVFWAGSTFALTRTNGISAELLFRPQMGAAVLVILTGGGLMGLLHRGPMGPMEQALAIGAISAIIAAGVQGVGIGPALRRLRAGGDEAAIRRRIVTVERIASLFLAITVVSMVVAKYV
jgi:hypothetical protein